VRHIRAGAALAVLQFHFESHTELRNIKRAPASIDADRFAYAPSLLGCESSRDAHVDLPWVLGSVG
jgi:hypothetical protein